MSVLQRFLDAGGTAILGVVVGAGLTYLFAVLNRRHQEAREDATRWYQTRLEAYAEFYRALSDGWLLAVQDERTEADHETVLRKLSNALGLIQLVGSPELILAAHTLFKQALKDERGRAQPELSAFVFVARKDLGYPVPRFLQKEYDRLLLADSAREDAR